jgi:mannose-6-phosphate isomerase
VSRVLPTRSVEKPWGVNALPPPFSAAEGQKIGEIWFEPPPELPELLVKYIFTSEALSVQVHPTDAQTAAKGLGHQGKEECWLIVSADEGARLGIGFVADIDAETVRAAALDGSIEHKLRWYPVQPGDFFYIPANTVHASGAGVGLIEVQQNSDITYRLYDYGRPRELHLDDSVAVAKGEPYASHWHKHVAQTGAAQLVEGPLFRLDQYDGPLPDDVAGRYAQGPLLVIPRSHGTRVGDRAVEPGQCALADGLDEVRLAPGALGLIAQPLPAARR